MIDKLLTEGVTVYSTNIAVRPGESTRDAEKRTVGELVRHIFGREAEISHNPDGAPFVAGIEARISVSHGAGKAVLALSEDKAVGVDIESERPQLDRVRGKFVSNGDSHMLPLVKLWTAKEAAFKAAGIPGLVISQMKVTTAPGENDRAVAELPDGRRLVVTFCELGSGIWVAVATGSAEKEHHE